MRRGKRKIITRKQVKTGATSVAHSLWPTNNVTTLSVCVCVCVCFVSVSFQLCWLWLARPQWQDALYMKVASLTPAVFISCFLSKITWNLRGGTPYC